MNIMRMLSYTSWHETMDGSYIYTLLSELERECIDIDIYIQDAVDDRAALSFYAVYAHAPLTSCTSTLSTSIIQGLSYPNSVYCSSPTLQLERA